MVSAATAGRACAYLAVALAVLLPLWRYSRSLCWRLLAGPFFREVACYCYGLSAIGKLTKKALRPQDIVSMAS